MSTASEPQAAPRTWSPSQLRLFRREAARRVRDAGKGMDLPPGYKDPFMAQEEQRAPAERCDSRPGTEAHIADVRRLLGRLLSGLARRAVYHDQSKLEAPEKPHFDRAASRLAGCTYDSAEYRAGLADLAPALEHHYAVNSHHPEHYGDGIRGMDLLDLVEMLADWKAASLRHADGDIRRSVEINQARFGYSDELKRIFLNTLPLLED